MGRSWPLLAALGSLLVRLGPILEALGAILGRLGGILGRSSGDLAAIFGAQEGLTSFGGGGARPPGGHF